MTNLRKTRNGMARGMWALALMLVWAICLSCISLAAEAKTFEQTMKITQTVDSTKGEPQRTKYTYTLRPNIAGSPMPKEGPGTYDAKTNTYTFTLDGNDSIDIPIIFQVDDETNYQYLITREEDVPVGDVVTPENHHFGYLFRVENEELVIIPYTCYDNQFKIWDKVDKDGNPIGVTLENLIEGTKSNSSSSSSTSTTRTTTTTRTNSTRTTTKTNVVTRTVSRVVNTGDPYQVGLWVALIVLALGALIVIAAIRRKKENDEEDI